MPDYRLMYVEDDASLAFVTKDNLEQHGYHVTHFDNGSVALNNFKSGNYDLCLLDVMLPKLDGFELAKKIRSINANVPILFLSARSADEDRIKGLKLGGDDYITKPYSIEELILKIQIFLKRNKIQLIDEVPSILTIKSSLLDIENQTLTIAGNTKHITERETKLLALFFQKPMQLIKREQILLDIWGDDGYFTGRSLDVFISKIRKYLKGDASLKIENIHGIGFRLIIQD